MIEKTIDEKLMTLSKIAEQLNKNNITWAVGASAMLYLRGIVLEFADIDFMIKEDDCIIAKNILMEMGTLKESNAGTYATKYFYEFTVNGIELDVMGGFAIVKDNIIYDCSLDTSKNFDHVMVKGEMIPMDSVQNWYHYYQLMGRDKKVELLKVFMEKSV
ncbi:MAG: hypothetical protein ACRC7V_01925 [Lachnospiraceae bacterium]